MVLPRVAVDPAALEVVDVSDAAAREDVFHDDEEELGAEDFQRVDAEVLVEEAAGDGAGSGVEEFREGRALGGLRGLVELVD